SSASRFPRIPRPLSAEALANALTHRDYTRRGALHVQWNDDQLEVSSHGGFPKVSVWTTFWSRPRTREVRCWRTPSSGRGWWNGPDGESTACSLSSCGLDGPHPTTAAAPRRKS